MILPPLEHRDRHAAERMDAPDCDRQMLERTYAQFPVVNALVAGWRTAYRRHVRPLLRRGTTTTALDIGSGGGDLTRALTRWARRDGFRLQITGIDPDPRAHAWAQRRPPEPGLSFRRALSGDLVAEGCSVDLVVSNHLLHHLDEPQLAALLSDSQLLARRRVIHSDIARSRTAYALFSIGTRPFFPGSFIREDGLTSIRRSRTADELRELAPSPWRVEQLGPWRNLLMHETPGA
ncbi:class I SAM-dependent methyltransferase [Brachybacterium sp. AOP43-C2-M15]|uniref:class I SAM-dependent methyltransferase n=1 Tax=Brachybacterium sp. AOP43-C2-M15 TaxID=3457661 RepID=UPI0040343EEC